MRKIAIALSLLFITQSTLFAEDQNENAEAELQCVEELQSTSKEAIYLAGSSGEVIKNMNNDPCKVYSKAIRNIKKINSKFDMDSVKQAFAYRKKNAGTFKGNPRYMMIADYSQTATKVRSMQIDLYTGEVVGRKISHGRTSDKGSHNSGVFNTCKRSNGTRTNATRPGFFKVENTYASSGGCTSDNYKKHVRIYGKPKFGCSHGEFRDKNGRLVYGWPYLGSGYPNGHNGIRMDGLNKGVNDKAKSNGVVMHGAWYNQGDQMGRSYGCPAFHPDEFRSVADALKDGALYYSYTPKCADDMKKILTEIPNWKNVCSI